MRNWSRWLLAACCVAFLLPLVLPAQAGRCTRVELTGEVAAGHEWRASFGQGWVFRVVPIDSGGTKGAYSGWDLVVDRERPAGYPDALLLATPPYNSINEREIGTTFGLRAQDALGWNPRSFHFLTDPAALAEAQKLYKELDPSHGPATQKAWDASLKLLHFSSRAASGEFRILDARLAPGIADAAPYAQNWALQAVKIPHTVEPVANGASKARGEFHWMKFSLTLWLPTGWKTPPGAKVKSASCGK